jgi:single-stranded DNA-binding protein
MNVALLSGKLTEDAELFLTRSGRPKITMRIGVPRDASMPPKDGNPRGMDFFTVVCYGERFTSLLEELKKGVRIFVEGFNQSRDIPQGRVVTEIVARTITIVEWRSKSEQEAL